MLTIRQVFAEVADTRSYAVVKELANAVKQEEKPVTLLFSGMQHDLDCTVQFLIFSVSVYTTFRGNLAGMRLSSSGPSQRGKVCGFSIVWFLTGK